MLPGPARRDKLPLHPAQVTTAVLAALCRDSCLERERGALAAIVTKIQVRRGCYMGLEAGICDCLSGRDTISPLRIVLPVTVHTALLIRSAHGLQSTVNHYHSFRDNAESTASACLREVKAGSTSR